jgi:ABC-type branched-subunit amino acid transport system ATPase component
VILELVGVAAGYGAKTVISEVSLALAPGQILALLGHNGAGKTTTLKTAMGLIPARAGEVRFDGAAITRLPVAERVARGLRLLPEGRGIFPDLSVAENIDVVAASLTGKGAMFDPASVYRLLPVLDERRATRAGSMSGGQQQMLAFALAILGTPRCLTNHRSGWRRTWWSGCSRRCAMSAARTGWPPCWWSRTWPRRWRWPTRWSS